MSSVLEKLKTKKEEISDLQKEKARQEGQRDQLLQQLKEKFNVSSLEEGKKKRQELEKEFDKNEKELEKLDNQMSEIISNATPSEKTED